MGDHTPPTDSVTVPVKVASCQKHIELDLTLIEKVASGDCTPEQWTKIKEATGGAVLDTLSKVITALCHDTANTHVLKRPYPTFHIQVRGQVYTLDLTELDSLTALEARKVDSVSYGQGFISLNQQPEEPKFAKEGDV